MAFASKMTTRPSASRPTSNATVVPTEFSANLFKSSDSALADDRPAILFHQVPEGAAASVDVRVLMNEPPHAFAWHRAISWN